MTALAPVQPERGNGAPADESGLPRILPPVAGPEVEPAAPCDFAAHARRHGLPRFRGAALIEQAATAGLTGRGGAAFPLRGSSGPSPLATTRW
jgi:hypothetical protein